MVQEGLTGCVMVTDWYSEVWRSGLLTQTGPGVVQRRWKGPPQTLQIKLAYYSLEQCFGTSVDISVDISVAFLSLLYQDRCAGTVHLATSKPRLVDRKRRGLHRRAHVSSAMNTVFVTCSW